VQEYRPPGSVRGRAVTRIPTAIRSSLAAGKNNRVLWDQRMYAMAQEALQSSCRAYSNLLMPVNPIAQPIRPLVYREKHVRGANGLCTHDGLTILEGGGRDIFGRCNGNNFVLVRDYCKHLNILTFGCYHLSHNWGPPQ
jgi:hypothetical protein